MLKLVRIMQVMNLIGDVKGKVAVLMDDMIDTAGKLPQINSELCHIGMLSQNLCSI